MAKHGSGSYDYVESRSQWRWRGYYHDPITRKLERKSFYAKTKKELREKVEDWLLQVDTGGAVKSLTLSKWADIWFDTIINDTVKVKTKEIYKYALYNHLLPKFGECNLQDLDARKFQAHLNQLSEKYSACTTNTVRRYSIMLLDAAVRFNYLEKNPFRNTRPKRQIKKEIVALSSDETNRIIDIARNGNYQEHQRNDPSAEYLRHAYATAIVVAIDCGLRKGEIFGLRWEDVFSNYILVRNNLVESSKGRILDTPKTLTSARKVIIGSRCINALQKWRVEQATYAERFAGIFLNPYNMVFTNGVGNFVSYNNFYKRCWKNIIKKAGLDHVKFHDLRHSHCSQLLAAGISPQIVSQRLGHSDLGVTLRVYAHILPNMQETALKQIDEIFSS